MAPAGRAVTRPASLLGRAIVLIALARAAPAAADPPSPRIDLTIDVCVGQDVRAVRSVVAMEVGTRPELAGTRGPVARVRIDCDGAATRIEIADPITGKTVTRRIQVGEASSAIRARVLGLAVAELLVASWVELQLPGESAAVSVDAIAPAADRAAVMSLVRGLERARPSPRRLTVTGFAAARFFTAGTQLSLVGMDVELRVSPRLALACDVTGERGDADNQLGRIETSVLSMAPRLDHLTTIDRLELAVGAGVRGGLARLSGLPADEASRGNTFTRPWAGAFASLRARALATDRWRLAVGIEAGITAVGVAGTVEGSDDPQVDGLWLAAWAGGAVGL